VRKGEYGTDRIDGTNGKVLYDLCQLKLAGESSLQETVFRVPASAGKDLIIKPSPAEAGTLNTVLLRHEALPGQVNVYLV